jgi:hypothetical protein
MEMNKINNNNLESIKAYYALQSKKSTKEEKQEEVKPVKEFETKKVDANALDLLAVQNQAGLAKVDTSDAAVEKRLQEAFANSTFMQSLNEMQGFEEDDNDFVNFAMANITGVNQDKLAKYLAMPLSQETVNGVANLAEVLIA